MGPMEMRKHPRHDLSAPVRFEWELSDGTYCKGSGITRDFSASGLFVLTGEPPPQGVIVHFEVDLSTSRLDSAVSIRAKGQVKRVETTGSVGQIGGFAISTRRMRLEKAEFPLEGEDSD